MIFISYAREDRADARALERDFTAAGIPFLRDVTLVEGDPFWRETIAGYLDQCSSMVVLWSHHALQSPWIEQELRGFPRRKLFVPLDSTPSPDDSASQCVSRREVIRCLAAEADLQASPSAGADLLPDGRETQVNNQRMSLYMTERARLAAFLDTPAGRRTVRLDAGADFALNQLDGTLMRRIPGSCGESIVYLGIEPVSNEQYRQFVDETGFPVPPTWGNKWFERYGIPVTGINWFEASAYAAWVGGRLPTETEWECAARGGDLELAYATMNGEISPAVAHYAQPFASSVPVQSRVFSPTQTGFYGMCGNVWEWCDSDWDMYKVIRGGSYLDSETFCRVTARYRNAPIDRDCTVGFRIAVEIANQE